MVAYVFLGDSDESAIKLLNCVFLKPELQGPMFSLKKISPKIWRKKWHFLLKTKLNYTKI
jgi:hypothetical protein